MTTVRQSSDQSDSSAMLSQLAESGSFSAAVQTVLQMRKPISQSINQSTSQSNHSTESVNADYTTILDQSLREKDTQIRAICDAHYLDFLHCLDELMLVQSEISAVKTELSQLNTDVQSSTHSVIQSATNLSDLRHAHLAANEAREQLIIAKQLMSVVMSASQQIEGKKLFSAIQTINQLTDAYLPSLPDNEFAQSLKGQLPSLISEIKQIARLDFKDWLSEMKNKSVEIGEKALKNQLDRLIRINQRRLKMTDRLLNELRGIGEETDQSDEEEGDQYDEDDLTEESINQSINFAPVYQCLHVYSQLNDREEFASLYHSSRRTALIAAMEYPPQSINKSINQSINQSNKPSKSAQVMAQLRQFFSSITGFFLLELGLMTGASELMPKSDTIKLWESAVTKIRSVLQSINQSINQSTPSKPSIKQLDQSIADSLTLHHELIGFISCFESSGFPLTNLLSIIEEQSTSKSVNQSINQSISISRVQFEQSLLNRFAMSITPIFENERYEPLTCADESAYESNVLHWGLSNNQSINQSIDQSFPLTLPFSAAVPQLCEQIERLIDQYAEWLLYDGPSTINQSTNQPIILSVNPTTHLISLVDRACIDHINQSINQSIEANRSIHISQAVQLSINALALADASTFAQYIIAIYLYAYQQCTKQSINQSTKQSLKQSINHIRSTAPRLQSRVAFQQTGARCENLLFELIDSKIDAFLTSFHQFDWLPASLCDADDYVVDLINYLDITFSCLVYLSENVREAVYFTSCTHIAKCLQNVILNVKSFNLLGWTNFSRDVALIEEFAIRCPIANLVETFSGVRQLTDMLVVLEVDQLIDPQIRATRLPQVSTNQIITILSKFKDFAVFPGAQIPERISKVKKRQVDAVLSKLKAMK